MPTFGVSAFLKLVSQNPKPQKTELRRRLFGSSGTAYDFHRSLKLAGRKLIVDGVPLPELLEGAKAIAQLPERKSLIAGLTRLGLWREGTSAMGVTVAPRVYESPKGLFKIAVQPEFGLSNEAGLVAFHLWNTKTVDLAHDAVYATLALFPQLYGSAEVSPTDFGVLSLHEPRAYRLSDKSAAVGHSWLVDRIETAILDIYRELDGPPAERPVGHPPPV